MAVVIVVAVAVDRFGHVERARPAPVIIVLGAHVRHDGTASGALRGRTEKAVALYRAGLASALLFSGGRGGPGPSEASVARDMAVAMGVPASACIVETQSSNTAENALFSAVILRDRGISSAIVVSDPYHLYRAQQQFLRQGIAVYMSPALEAARHQGLRARALWTLREVGALFADPRLFFVTGPQTS